MAVPDPSPFAGLSYRFIGPPGNRVSAVVGVSGDPNTYYAGAASGGVWKSSDGGIHWKPVFDEQPAQSIGAIAIAPSDPNVVWVGTGEPFIRSNVSLGNGVYRSTDAGKTWVHLGPEKTGRIARIVVDPKNPNVALVAASSPRATAASAGRRSTRPGCRSGRSARWRWPWGAAIRSGSMRCWRRPARLALALRQRRREVAAGEREPPAQ